MTGPHAILLRIDGPKADWSTATSLMSLSPSEIPRRALFRAAEVCEIAQVQPYVLRTWEAEFPELGVTPPKGGARVYRRADLERVLRLKHLLFEEGLTLAGARRKLELGEAPTEGLEASGIEHLLAQDVRERLAELRGGLRAILEQLSRNARSGGAFSLTGPPRDGDAGHTSVSPDRRSRQGSAVRPKNARIKRRGRSARA